MNVSLGLFPRKSQWLCYTSCCFTCLSTWNLMCCNPRGKTQNLNPQKWVLEEWSFFSQPLGFSLLSLFHPNPWCTLRDVHNSLCQQSNETVLAGDVPQVSRVSFSAGLVVFNATAQLSSFAPIGNIRWQKSLSSNCLIQYFEVTPQWRTNTPSSLTCVCSSAPKYHVQAESELDSCLGWMLNKWLWRNRFCAFSPEEGAW